MPQIGEITKGKEIGKLPKWKQYLWARCPDCGKERWVQAKQGTPDHILCKNCYMVKMNHRKGDKTWNWKGGKTTCMGYPAVMCPGHHRAHKRTGYVLEHIIVWEKTHNQLIPEGSHIHHINGIKTDNRPSNLVCLTSSKHAIKHQTLTQIRLQRIRELETEVKMLERTLQDSQMIFRLEEN